MDAAETIRRLGLDGRRRSASTAIHYLLPPGARSAWHRLASDEVWHHYDGGPLLLHLLGTGTNRLDRSDSQIVVPAGVWQAAEPEGEGALCGCTVAPGFEFADFEMGRAEELVREFPDDEELIRRLIR